LVLRELRTKRTKLSRESLQQVFVCNTRTRRGCSSGSSNQNQISNPPCVTQDRSSVHVTQKTVSFPHSQEPQRAGGKTDTISSKQCRPFRGLLWILVRGGGQASIATNVVRSKYTLWQSRHWYRLFAVWRFLAVIRGGTTVSRMRQRTAQPRRPFCASKTFHAANVVRTRHCIILPLATASVATAQTILLDRSDRLID